MVAKEITPAGAVLSIITFFLMWQAGLFDQIGNNAENLSDSIQTNAENIKEIDYSSLLESGKTVCNIDDIVLEKIVGV